MNDVIEIDRIEELENYRLAWSALHSTTHGASFFNTLEWLQTYWKHFGRDQGLRVMIARAGGKPIGVMPLVLRREPSQLGGLRVLTYPLDYWGSVYRPVSACPSAMLAVVMRHLAESRHDWDLFEPRWTPAEGSGAGRLTTAMDAIGMTPVRQPHEEYSLVECDRFPSWEAYLGSRSAKTRHEMRRKRRRLERDHRIEHVRYRPDPARGGDGDPAWELYEQCLAVSSKSWQARSTTGNTLCQGKVTDFLADAHREAARVGMLDMNLLLADGKPVAYFYGYQTHGWVSGLRMGYDPEGPAGSGAVLLDRVIEDSFRRGDQKIDLGVGAEAFKARVRTSVASTYRLTHYSPHSWRGGAIRVLRNCRRGWRKLRDGNARRIRPPRTSKTF